MLVAASLISAAGCGTQHAAAPGALNCPHIPAPRNLTTSANVRSVSVSADGRHVAWINSTEEQRDSAIWLKRAGDTAPLELFPAQQDLEYHTVTLSPDASSIYFTRSARGAAAALYMAPVSGGEVRLVAENIKWPAAVSPDGRRLVFIRSGDTSASLVMANREGSAEHELATAAGRLGFARRPAWSPDGERIACYNLTHPGIDIVNTSDGTTQRLGGENLSWGNGLVWLNETTLLAAATVEGVNGVQLWCIDAATGERKALTEGLRNFGDLGLTRDGATLIATRQLQSGDLWRIPIAGGPGVQMTTNPVEGEVDGYGGVSALPDGDVLFVLLNGSGIAVLSHGERRILMTPPRREAYSFPAVSRDGRTVAVVVRRADNIQRIHLADRDGLHVRPIPGLPEGTHAPQFSADDQSLIYTQDGPMPSVWTIPVAGGTPRRIAEAASHCAVAPDGQQLACFVRGGLGILPLTGGSATKIFPESGPAAGAEPPIRWTMDGRNVLVKGSADARNAVWLQPLDGSARRRVTDFPPGLVYSFDVTPDGQSIIASFGRHSEDVIEVTIADH